MASLTSSAQADALNDYRIDSNCFHYLSGHVEEYTEQGGLSHVEHYQPALDFFALRLSLASDEGALIKTQRDTITKETVAMHAIARATFGKSATHMAAQDPKSDQVLNTCLGRFVEMDGDATSQ